MEEIGTKPGSNSSSQVAGDPAPAAGDPGNRDQSPGQATEVDQAPPDEVVEAPEQHRRVAPFSRKAWENRASRLAVILLTRMRYVPDGLLDPLGRVLGSMAFALWKRYRRVALENLAMAFPEKSAGEREQIARSTFRNWGMFLFQSLKLSGFTERDWEEKVIIEGREIVERVLDEGRGVVIVSGHFGCFEMGAAVIAHEGVPVSVVVRYAKTQEITERMNALRESAGYRVLCHDARGFRAMKNLRNGEIVCILIDQDAGRHGVFVNYFGRPASTPPGPAVLAARTNAAIIPAFVVRGLDGRYRLIAQPELPNPGPDATPEMIRDTMQAVSDRLEAMVREYPDHWLWMHRRWKSQPRQEEAP